MLQNALKKYIKKPSLKAAVKSRKVRLNKKFKAYRGLRLRKIRKNTLRTVVPTEEDSLPVNRLLVWDRNKPVKYAKVTGNESISICEGAVTIRSAGVIAAVDKSVYGAVSLIIDSGQVNKEGLPYFFDNSSKFIKPLRIKAIKENKVINLYTSLFLFSSRLPRSAGRAEVTPLNLKGKQPLAEKRGYLKHLVRLRYRWFFKPKLAKFKLFKKFFKRSLKRFRKINKNRLFVEKFRSHFSRLTGFKEKALFKLWLPFRRNYNQYWSTTNAVLRFSQSLILTPPSFLVFLRISPSLAASKYLVKSGAVSVNGLSATNFTVFKSGDIMQLNIGVWNAVRSFFSYQRWSKDFRNLQQIPFLYIDWSSMIFFMLRWPHKHELVAPSFLSERWVRYYIRLFPVKTGKFKRARNNLKIYKKVLTKQ